MCVCTDKAKSQPIALLRSLCGMMCERIPGFKERLCSQKQEDVTAALSSTKAGEVFETLIRVPASQVSREPSDKPYVIIIDALDELPAKEMVPLVQLIVEKFSNLPLWLRLFVTSRKIPEIENELCKKFKPDNLLVGEERNQRDVRAYLGHIVRKYVAFFFVLLYFLCALFFLYSRYLLSACFYTGMLR